VGEINRMLEKIIHNEQLLNFYYSFPLRVMKSRRLGGHVGSMKLFQTFIIYNLQNL
jgi:hypothetical protein